MSPHTVGIFALPFSIAGLAYELNKTRNALATSKWKQVPCTVSNLEILPEDSRVSDKETYSVCGNYSYQVNGENFTSENISNRHCRFLSKQEAASLTAGLPRTGSHFAYYNPAKPQEAVLVTGNDMANLKQIAIFVLGIGLSLFLIMKH
jgi:hypothetical protein